jgi:hypothetical protein
MGEIKYQGDPPYHLPTTQRPVVRGGGGVVELTLFASVAGKGSHDVPVRLGLSINEANQFIADLRRAIEEARQYPQAR